MKKTNKDLVIIVTTNKYPNGDAGAIRQHVIAKALRENGYDVFIIGYGESTNEINTFEDIPYISMRAASNNIIIRLISRIMFGRKVSKYIQKHFKQVKGFLVIDRFARFVF